MNASIASLDRQRKALLHLYPHHPQPEVRHRAHVLCSWPTATPGRPSPPSSTPAAASSPAGSNASTMAACRPGRSEARTTVLVLELLGRRRRPLGHPADAAYLRLPPQPLDLCVGRCASVALVSTGRQPRDGPSLAAPSRPGLASPPPGGPSARPAAARQLRALR